ERHVDDDSLRSNGLHSPAGEEDPTQRCPPGDRIAHHRQWSARRARPESIAESPRRSLLLPLCVTRVWRRLVCRLLWRLWRAFAGRRPEIQRRVTVSGGPETRGAAVW